MAIDDSASRGRNRPVPNAGRVAAPAAVSAPAADASTSAVSWGAIFAGAAAAAALSLILLILGVGLGLSSVSPWSRAGIGAGAFGISTVVWLTFTQLAASGMGGYLAGRLRSKWLAVHTDEVYFRDTAHGFLSWAVATLATAAMLGSAIGSVVAGTAQAGAAVAGGAASTALTAGGAALGAANRGGGDSAASGGGGPMGYAIDTLMRRTPGVPSSGSGGGSNGNASAAPSAAMAGMPASGDTSAPSSAEVGRIFANALRTGNLSADDSRYVGQLVAQRTGLAPADAEKRVTDTFTRMQSSMRDAETTARDTADKARKATAYAALWVFVSMLIGAFVASWAATAGGRHRDL